MKKYYHLSSSSIEKSDIFLEEEDFIQGVNDLALCILNYDIGLLGYCLMSNHFHFIMKGEKDACHDFAIEFKKRCSMRMRTHRMEVKGLQHVEIQVNELDTQEYLEHAIAYVLRNPLAARILVMPHHYKWSSAGIYFKGKGHAEGVRLHEMTERGRRRLLKSKIQVPDSYVVDNDGMIRPECFVDYKEVENIFKHPSRLLILLAKKLEADVEIKFGLADKLTYSDHELCTLTNKLIVAEFQVADIALLTKEQRIRLCFLLKRNYGASAKQISRITRIDQEIVKTIM